LHDTDDDNNDTEATEIQNESNHLPTPQQNEQTVQLNREDQERIKEMKTKILEKWLEVKEEKIEERSKLPKIKMNRKTKKVMKLANKCIEDIKNEHNLQDITDINSLMYSAAHTVTMETGNCPIKKKIKKTNRRSEPRWKDKLKKEIERLRKDVAILAEAQNPNSNISEWKRNKIFKNYKIRSIADIAEVKE